MPGLVVYMHVSVKRLKHSEYKNEEFGIYKGNTICDFIPFVLFCVVYGQLVLVFTCFQFEQRRKYIYSIKSLRDVKRT